MVKKSLFFGYESSDEDGQQKEELVIEVIEDSLEEGEDYQCQGEKDKMSFAVHLLVKIVFSLVLERAGCEDDWVEHKQEYSGSIKAYLRG